MRPAVFLLGTLEVGGSERKFVRIANALAGAGREVRVAWLGPPDTLADDIDPGVVRIPFGRRGKYSLPALRRLAGLIRRERPSAVVNVNFYPLAYSVPARFGARDATRLLGSINTTDLPGTRESRFMRLYAPLLRSMDRVVFGCKAQAEQWQGQFGIRRDRSEVVYNGVDAGRFALAAPADRAAARQRFGLPGEAPVAVCVAQLRPEKAHTDLVEALARAEGKALRLLLVGEGRMRDEIRRVAVARGVADRVVFAGQLADVRPALAAADMFVLSSVTVETFSNAALEAAASGLPVVITNIGGARELVADGETGIVVPPASPAALAGAMDRLAADASLARRMGGAGRARTVSHFAFERMVADWARLIWAAEPGRAVA